MANLSELIRQKEQQTEEWKQRKADERDSLNDMNDAAALRVTESTGAFLHYLDVQADNPSFQCVQCAAGNGAEPGGNGIQQREGLERSEP